VRQPLPSTFSHAPGVRLWGIALALAVFLFLPTTARAQSAQNVLLVINAASADSVKVGEHYARTRSVPAGQVVRIQAPVAEAISRAAYQASIEAPIAEWLSRYLLQDQILFIVLTKGIPLRVDGTSGQSGNDCERGLGTDAPLSQDDWCAGLSRGTHRQSLLPE
jgi:hypothetical protein